MRVQWLPMQIVKSYLQPTRHEKHAEVELKFVPQWISQMKTGCFGRLGVYCSLAWKLFRSA